MTQRDFIVHYNLSERLANNKRSERLANNKNMAFLNPLFLFGLLAAGIPLLIHLWNRRRVVTIDFSSLMFLVAAHRQNVRRVQLKNLLILLLRMLIVALIALALARPFLTLGLPLSAVRAKTDVVIILDNSYSMAYEGVEGVAFEKAKALGIEVLRSLRHGDNASLILMSDVAQPIFRQLTPDIEGVIAAVDDAAISYRATNVQPSLELAHEMLTGAGLQTPPTGRGAFNREIYLISDFAENGWANWGRVPNLSDARIFLLPVTEQNRHNTNIEEIITSNQLIGMNLSFHMRVTTTNHSAAPLEQSTLNLFIGGQKRRTMTFTAAADESLTTPLTHRFSTPGTHTGYFTLTPDRLNVDNRRYFAFEALGEVRVLCVGEQTHTLTLALNPDNGTMLLPTACTPAEFETFPLEDYEVVILADIPKVTAPMRAQLQTCIRTGKSIIAFTGSEPDAQFRDILPAQIGMSRAWTPPQQITEYNAAHPIFDIFPNDGFPEQYAPQFHNGTELVPLAEANVIARFGDGTPFLIEKGQVLLYNCGIQTQLLNPYFLPLLQQSVLYARVMGVSHHSDVKVGEPWTARYPRSAGATATIKRTEDVLPHIGRGPVPGHLSGDTENGAPESITDEDMSERIVEYRRAVEEDGTLRFEETERPGIYQVEVRTRGRLARDFFAVNVDSVESDLAQVDIEKAASRIGAVFNRASPDASFKATDEAAGTDTAVSYDVQRHGREIWGELLILAVTLLFIESFVSNRGRAAGASNG